MDAFNFQWSCKPLSCLNSKTDTPLKYFSSILSLSINELVCLPECNLELPVQYSVMITLEVIIPLTITSVPILFVPCYWYHAQLPMHCSISLSLSLSLSLLWIQIIKKLISHYFGILWIIHSNSFLIDELTLTCVLLYSPLFSIMSSILVNKFTQAVWVISSEISIDH